MRRFAYQEPREERAAVMNRSCEVCAACAWAPQLPRLQQLLWDHPDVFTDSCQPDQSTPGNNSCLLSGRGKNTSHQRGLHHQSRHVTCSRMKSG